MLVETIEAPAATGTRRRASRGPWIIGLALAIALAAGATCWARTALPYINWRSVAIPIDQPVLIIRHDGKGDGRFGSPRSGGRTHRGVDLEAPVGTPVRAIRSGIVEINMLHRGLGKYIQIRHDDELESIYAHLQTSMVTVGERVKQGQIIGTVGKTGNARHRVIKPHLHLEVLRRGQPFDPATLGLVMVQPREAIDHGEAQGGE